MKNQDAFLLRLSQSFGKDVSVRLHGVKQQGNDVFIDELTIKGSALSPDTSLKAVKFSGISETNRDYAIKKMDIASIHYLYEGSNIDAQNIVLYNVILPPNKGLFNQNIGFQYSKGQFKQIFLTDWRKKILGRLENGVISLRPSIRQNPISFSIAVTKVTVHVSNFPEGSTRTDFMAMGYGQATGNLRMEGAYGGDQSVMDLKNFALSLDNGGHLTGSFKMDGMTLESLLTIVTLQRENGRGNVSTSRMILGMIGQIQRYNFYGGHVRFDDRSFTQKLIQVEARRDNLTNEELKKNWNDNLPGWLSFAKETSFAQEAHDAINDYLLNPVSLEISSKPMKKLSLIMLAISGKLNQKQFIRQLNLKIMSNQKN
ncbi:hypothetical protein [Bartonella tamiae]|uniref:hypothetical protein n=1 Tax=Bartonella tamiae TaxID=373638 RepID=UPI0003051D51|nr:hypothetical protein [Bartonella tamiae]